MTGGTAFSLALAVSIGLTLGALAVGDRSSRCPSSSSWRAFRFVAEKGPGELLSRAFGWFVVVLAVVIGGLAAAGVRTTTLT